jgi:hypothetical protein
VLSIRNLAHTHTPSHRLSIVSVPCGISLSLSLDHVHQSASIISSSASAIGATLGSFWATSKVALDMSGVVDQTVELTSSVSNKSLEALDSVSRKTYIALRQPHAQ